MNKQEILKESAKLLRSLNHDVEIQKLAEEVVRKLLQYEELTGTETLQKIAEFRSKSKEELEVIEKAIELTKSGSLNLGHISEQINPAGLDPLTAFLVSEQ